MTDKPIIFSAPMVRAMLDGRKTQTRRLLKKTQGAAIDRGFDTGSLRLPYAPGDRIYVRESFMPAPMEVAPAEPRPTLWNIAYGAGGQVEIMAPANYNPMLYNYERWDSSTHMPRWASRLTLTVTEVGVQRLQDISAGDSIAEGVECDTCTAMGQSACHGRGCFASIDAYRHLWNSLHGPDAWDANPWVVALTFTVQHGNIDRVAS